MKRVLAYIILLSGFCVCCFGQLFASGDASSSLNFLVPLGAAIAIAVAALGGTLAQGMAISRAMDGVSRNPGAVDKMFKLFILGLAFIEAQTIFAFVISFLILEKM